MAGKLNEQVQLCRAGHLVIWWRSQLFVNDVPCDLDYPKVSQRAIYSALCRVEDAQIIQPLINIKERANKASGQRATRQRSETMVFKRRVKLLMTL